jgi:hypothetical protein
MEDYFWNTSPIYITDSKVASVRLYPYISGVLNTVGTPLIGSAVPLFGASAAAAGIDDTPSQVWVG